MPTLDDKEECFGRVTEIDTGHLTARGAMAEETRVYLSGIPFLMNEEWKGWHRSKTQWANAFLWCNSKEDAQAVATSLDGLTLPGWWRPFKAELACDRSQTGIGFLAANIVQTCMCGGLL